MGVAPERVSQVFNLFLVNQIAWVNIFGRSLDDAVAFTWKQKHWCFWVFGVSPARINGNRGAAFRIPGKSIRAIEPTRRVYNCVFS